MRLRLNCCTVDLHRREVARGAQTQPLSEHEAGLLAYLSQRPGQSVSRQELLAEVWGWRARGVTRAVDNTVMRLRTKIERPGAAPEHLLTVRGVGYRFEGPPPDRPPPAHEALVGRGDALAVLQERLRAGGLHTLLGPGGVGKTALAQAALQQSRGVFCELAGAQTPRAAAGIVAGALGATGHDPIAAVAGHLPTLSGVLVLDNVEQLVEDGWEVFQRWARAAGPTVALLATSRVRIGIPEEQAFPLGPLPTDDAVTLLQIRSQRAVAPPTEDEQQLVEMVDGLPLAIELIAGWAELATPTQLHAQLQGRPMGLESRGRRTARHRSLQAVLDGSWALLGEDEARALRRLAAFVGAFTLEGASAVCGRPVLQALGRLVDASMLQRSRDEEGVVRFRMLSLVAADAARRLAADPAEQAEAHHQHARWMARQLLALEARKNRDRGGYNRWVRRARGDLLVVIERFQETRPALAAEAVSGLGILALSEGDPPTELARVRSISDRLPPTERWVRLVQLEASWLLRLYRADEFNTLVEAVLPQAWKIAPGRAGFLVCTAAFQQILSGQPEAATARLEAALPRLANDPPYHALMTGYLGLSWYARRALDRAEPLLRDAIARLDAVGNHVGRDWFAEKHALTMARLGEMAGAAETLARLLSRAEDAQMRQQASELARHLGVVLIGLDRLDEADQRLQYAIALCDGKPSAASIIGWMGRGDIAIFRNEPAHAQTCWAQARALLAQKPSVDSTALLDARALLLSGHPDQIPHAADEGLRPELEALRTGTATDQDLSVQISARLYRTVRGG